MTCNTGHCRLCVHCVLCGRFISFKTACTKDETTEDTEITEFVSAAFELWESVLENVSFRWLTCTTIPVFLLSLFKRRSFKDHE